jgi:drug/metabolite transporter (DMT)-like permease
MPPRARSGDWSLLVVLSLIWGTSFLFNKLAVASLPPATIVAGRLTVAAALLLAVVRLVDRRLPRSPSPWLWFLAMAVVGNAVPFTLITWGQQTVDSGLAGILMAVMPLTTVLMAHFFVAGERMTAARVAGFVLGFAGIVVLTGPAALRELGGSGSQLLRQLAILLAAMCYAANTIIARRMPPTDTLVTSCGVLVCGSAVMLPMAVLFETPWTSAPTVTSLIAVAWLGLTSTGIAMFIYYRIIESAGPTFISQMNYMIPVVAAFAGVVLMGEHLAWTAFLALAMILAGVALAQLSAASRAVESGGGAPVETGTEPADVGTS